MKLIKNPHDDEYQKNEPLLGKLIPDDGLLLKHFIKNFQDTKALILSLPENKLLFRYAYDKWTIKEIMMHLIDMERIYTYRMLRFARNDETGLPGFDDKHYVLHSGANDRDINDLLEELNAIRHSTISLINGFTEQAILRSGIINGNRVSVRALAYHIAGHELHHLGIIKERYLKPV